MSLRCAAVSDDIYAVILENDVSLCSTIVHWLYLIDSVCMEAICWLYDSDLFLKNDDIYTSA